MTEKNSPLKFAIKNIARLMSLGRNCGLEKYRSLLHPMVPLAR